MKRLVKYSTLALHGGVIYYIIEAVYKSLVGGGVTHWTMAVIGGIMFLAIGGLNNHLPWEMPLWVQCVFGSLMITAVELVAGLILNVYMGLAIWDYSHIPFNLGGQICLRFSIAWVGLSLIAIGLDDWLRYWLWDEERPTYHLI